MMGILEILVIGIMCCLLWLLIFKFLLKFHKNKILKDIANKIEKQANKFIYDGKEVDLKKEMGLKK